MTNQATVADYEMAAKNFELTAKRHILMSNQSRCFRTKALDLSIARRMLDRAAEMRQRGAELTLRLAA